MVPDPPVEEAHMVGTNIPLYSFSLGGIVLAPRHAKLSCAYPYDVGSSQPSDIPSTSESR